MRTRLLDVGQYFPMLKCRIEFTLCENYQKRRARAVIIILFIQFVSIILFIQFVSIILFIQFVSIILFIQFVSIILFIQFVSIILFIQFVSIILFIQFVSIILFIQFVSMFHIVLWPQAYVRLMCIAVEACCQEDMSWAYLQ